MTQNNRPADNLIHPVTTSKFDADELCQDARTLLRTKNFLDSYQVAIRMLRLCREDARARAEQSEFCGLPADHCRALGGAPEQWLAQLSEVRDFIESLPNRSAKLLLYYHYVRNLTVERAAEELDISRRAAFRLKKKALAYAAARLGTWQAARRSSVS